MAYALCEARERKHLKNYKKQNILSLIKRRENIED